MSSDQVSQHKMIIEGLIMSAPILVALLLSFTRITLRTHFAIFFTLLLMALFSFLGNPILVVLLFGNLTIPAMVVYLLLVTAVSKFSSDPFGAVFRRLRIVCFDLVALAVMLG